MLLNRAAAAVAALFAAEAIAFASWLPRLPELREALALSEGELGLILLAMPAAALLVMPLAGWFSTHLPVRTLNLLCMGWLLTATALLPLATSGVGLAFALFLIGVGTGSMGVAMNAPGLAVERALGWPVCYRAVTRCSASA